MRVLVTNDDGVAAPGLAHLARALRDSGYEVTVAAPLKEASGAGAGVGPIHTMGDGVVVRRLELPGLDGVPAFGVDALPALIVIAGCLGAFGSAPDLVVAGINPGRNVGRATLHSGTVGAALTSVHFDKRALAISIQSGPFSGFEFAGEHDIHFETAAAVAVALLPEVASAPARTVVNCNVPNLRLHDLRGARWAHLAPSGLVRSVLVGTHARTLMHLKLGLAEPQEGDMSDEVFSTLGYVTLTPLASVSEDLRPEVQNTIGRSVAAVTTALGMVGVASPDEGDGPAA